ncbi:Sodium- and chloride-dependent GABA transporter 1 [Diplodia seriata]
MATTTHYGQASYLHGNEGFHTAGSPSNIPSLTPASTRGSSYDTSSPPYLHTRNDVLEGTVFPEFRKNEDSDVNKLQEEDPMGIDMWKFYRNQSNVPDAERMENMTWRMMAINLRKAQQKKDSSHAAVGHARVPDAENWSKQQSMANPSKPNPMTPGGRMGTIKSEDLGDYQFNFTSNLLQIPNGSAYFQTPFEYSVLNGPRGHVRMPDGLKQDPDMAGTHARHVSLGAGYPDDSFGIKSDLTHVQHASGGNVTPWDPGWAEEAFGGQSLYDTPAVKKEEIEHEPLFDAGGYLLPENWITHDPPQDFGSQSSMLNHHETAQSLSQWQQFEHSHYAEFSGQRPQFGTQPDQYGPMFTTSGYQQNTE